MKEFGAPMVTISQEQFDQLKLCQDLIAMLWRQFGPYNWPVEFRVIDGKSILGFNRDSEEYKFLADFTYLVSQLMSFDDSE